MSAFDPANYQDLESYVHRVFEDLGFDKDLAMDDDAARLLTMIRRWISEANERLGVGIAYREYTVRLTVANCAARKPTDYISMRHITVTDQCVTPLFVTDRPRRSPANACPVWGERLELRETDTHFLTDSRLEGHPIDLTYKALYFGTDGAPFVDRNYYSAYEAYVGWKYAQRERETALTVSAAWANFLNQSRICTARATVASLNPQQIEQIFARFNDPFYVNESAEARRVNVENATPRIGRRGGFGGGMLTGNLGPNSF